MSRAIRSCSLRMGMILGIARMTGVVLGSGIKGNTGIWTVGLRAELFLIEWWLVDGGQVVIKVLGFEHRSFNEI